MTPGELNELWIFRIKDYQAREETVAAWCERDQVSPHSVWYWQRSVLRAEQSEK